MKTVILAGGMATRFIEQTAQKPKTMIEVVGKPLLWHILNVYSVRGFDDFVVACGYKRDYIRDYFANFFHQKSDILVGIAKNRTDILRCHNPQWRLWLIETGFNTMTGGRLLQLNSLINADRQLMNSSRTGFWSHMDSAHEHQTLQDLGDSGSTAWNTWE